MTNDKIYEPSLEPEVVKEWRAHATAKSISGVIPPGESRLTGAPKFDLDRVKRLMEGAFDIHIHSNPDPYTTRLGDQIDFAIQACDAGMGGVLFGEPHHVPSSFLVPQTRKVVNQWADEHGKKRIDVFGGVALNYPVGGLNPAVVVTSARLGGRVVWPPGVNSRHYHKLIGAPSGIEVIDENSNVVPAMKEILALIAEGDMVLALSCLGVKDVFCLIDEAKKIGVKPNRINVVHPMQTTSLMTVEQMKIAADKGAFIELTCNNFKPPLFTWGTFMEVYNKIGPDRMIMSTDNGVYTNYTPVVALHSYIVGCLIHGIPDKDVEKMVKTNPRNLLC